MDKSETSFGSPSPRKDESAGSSGTSGVAPTSDNAVIEAARIAAHGAIVAAFASRETATIPAVLELSKQLWPALSGNEPSRPAVPATAANTQAAPEMTAQPALKIEDSVTNDKVYCLCCGRGFTMLKRHLKAEHGLTEAQYRTMFGLPEDFPLVAPSYSERKAKYAKQVGLGKYARDKGADEHPTPI